MTKLEKLCIKWLNDNYNHMEPFYMEKYPDYIFHMKNGQCILQYNKKNGYVYVSYKEIWSFFERMFGMDNQQIKDITKIWVEEHYKMGVTSTIIESNNGKLLVEEHYKMGVTSTLLSFQLQEEPVEEHYKMGVTSTTHPSVFFPQWVEEHYKNEVKTTDFINCIVSLKVEEQYQEIQTTNNQLEFYDEKDVEKLYEQETNG